MRIVFSSVIAVCLCAWGSAVLPAADIEILEKKDLIRIETASFASEHHTQVVKILTEKGTSYKEYLAVNNNIQIKNIHVTITSDNGRVSKLKQDEIYEVPIVESPDMVTDYKALVIAPRLRRGDTVTLEYDRTISSLLYIDPWVYATNFPIRKASCLATYPANLPLKFRGEDDSVRVQKSEQNGMVALRMETADRGEVFLSGRSESFGSIEKKVVFMPEQTMTEKWFLSTKSWRDVAQWFSDLTKFAYQEHPEMDAVVRRVLQEAKSPEQIAEGLYRYIQNHFVYMAVEIGIGGYKPRFASQTFQKKYGDCKDLTFLYVVLLRKAGVEAYPALVDTRHSKFFYRDFPSPTQFNHCIAYLPKIRNGVWVDTTVKNFRLGEMPTVIQGKMALVAGGPNTLIQIPEDFQNSNVLKFELKGEYAGSRLQMAGAVHTLGQANAYVDLMKNALLRNAVKNYVYSKLLKQGLPIQQLNTSKADDRSLEIRFTTPVQSLEPYKVLLVNAVSYPPLENLGSDPRPNEFFALGIPVRLVLDTTVHLAGHVLVSPAEFKEKKGDFLSYTLQLKEENGKLRYFADVYFANGFLDSAEMKKYKQELQEFAAILQRTVIIR
jgi:hypothetical protein